MRHQCQMHTQFNAVVSALCNTEVLNAVTEFIGVNNILWVKTGDTLYTHAIKLQRDAERGGSHDREFVRGVYTFNVIRRIGFGVTEQLRTCQCVFKRLACAAHLRQDEIAGAVNDTDEP